MNKCDVLQKLAVGYAFRRLRKSNSIRQAAVKKRTCSSTSDPRDAAVAVSSTLAADPKRPPAQTFPSCVKASCEIGFVRSARMWAKTTVVPQQLSCFSHHSCTYIRQQRFFFFSGCVQNTRPQGCARRKDECTMRAPNEKLVLLLLVFVLPSGRRARLWVLQPAMWQRQFLPLTCLRCSSETTANSPPVRAGILLRQDTEQCLMFEAPHLSVGGVKFVLNWQRTTSTLTGS